MATLVLSIVNGYSSLADKKNNYKSLDEFEFCQDPITYNGVSSPCAFLKLMDNFVTTLAPSFLIESSLFFQVSRTTIKAWINAKFGRIRSGTYELAALEHLEKTP